MEACFFFFGVGILDALPIIIDEASFPVEEKCAFRNSHVSSSLLR
jgi:hypothetical protein